jgi:hypothetical protein
MSLSVISSELSAVNQVPVQKAAAEQVKSQPSPEPPSAPRADTVTVSPEAQKLQLGDVDRDGDSH